METAAGTHLRVRREGMSAKSREQPCGGGRGREEGSGAGQRRRGAELPTVKWHNGETPDSR